MVNYSSYNPNGSTGQAYAGSGDTVIFSSPAAMTINSTLTLSGSGTFVFISSELDVSSNIILIDEVSSDNVFFITTEGDISLLTGVPVGNFITGLDGAATPTINVSSTVAVLGRTISLSVTGVMTFGESEVNNSPVCYREGTKILTAEGYKLIEDLTTLDSLVTTGIIEDGIARFDKQIQDVTYVGSFEVNSNYAKHNLPIKFSKGSLGENKPFEDLYVSPNHGILKNNFIAVASSFINGTTIVQVDEHKPFRYYHVQTNDHSLIIVNGIESETLNGEDEVRTRFSAKEVPSLLDEITA
jgi:hypothetical protein